MTERKVYRCNHCGNILSALMDGGVTPVCCGEETELLVPTTADAAVEKHVPVITIKENVVTVKVGSVDHPMTEEHYIPWVMVLWENTSEVVHLKPGDVPQAIFTVTEQPASPSAFGEKAHALGLRVDTMPSDIGPVIAFAYCNLHGLWRAEI